MALLIHEAQAESGHVFTDFSASGHGGLFAGGIRSQQLVALPTKPFIGAAFLTRAVISPSL